MVKKFLVLMFFLLLSSLSYSQQISAKAYTDSAKYKVGDYINYTIVVNYDKNITIQNPVIKDTLKNLEIINIENPVTEEKDGKQTTKFVYVVSYYDSSDVIIPSININFTIQGDKNSRSVTTNAVKFTVQTVAVDTQKGIKDIKEPVTIPFNWNIVLLIILAVLILLLIAYYVWRYYKKKNEQKEIKVEKVVLPYYQIALNSLKELEEKKLWQNGRIKEYHSEITEIIRLYFEKRFNLPALELTTSEALYQLRNIGSARNIVPITENFLNNADMVKFAKFQPFYSINEEMMKQAVEIVSRTIPLEDAKREGEEKSV
jgi:hypothetical protein